MLSYGPEGLLEECNLLADGSSNEVVVSGTFVLEGIFSTALMEKRKQLEPSHAGFAFGGRLPFSGVDETPDILEKSCGDMLKVFVLVFELLQVDLPWWLL